ncbi:MAG: hypothetical protein ABSD31_10200 [Candidatus Binataceae bacterium]|jgi:hypothetical protein
MTDKLELVDALSVAARELAVDHRGAGVLDQTAADSEFIEPLSDMLSRYPAAKLFDGRLQLSLNFGLCPGRHDLAEWLVARTQTLAKELDLSLAADRAVSDLDKYAAAETVPVRTIVPLNLAVSEPIRLSEGVVLVPFTAVPDSQTKRLFVSRHVEEKLEWLSEYVIGESTMPSALVLQTQRPKAVEEEGYYLAISGAHLGRMLGLVAAFIQALCIVGPNHVCFFGIWEETDRYIPCGDKSVQAEGLYFPRDNAIRSVLPVAAHKMAGELCGKYLSLPDTLTKVLRISVERLNSALSRHDLTDRAIDLGIAFESLFFHSSHADRGEQTFSLKLRVARFLRTTPRRGVN